MNEFKFKDDALQTAFDNILDTFGGADGGISFTHFRAFLEGLDMSNDESSDQLLLIVKRFSKMIDIANGRG